MERFIISISHTMKDCVQVLKQIEAIGTITHFDWGCKDGEHTGWAIIEAEDKNQALLSVPSMQRSKAHVVKLNRFSPEDIKALHS